MKKIVIVTGDPNSINSEIIFKSWKRVSKNLRERIFFVSNINLLKKQFKKLNLKLKIIEVKNTEFKRENDGIKVINIDLKFKNPFKVNFKESSKFIQQSLRLVHKIGLKKNVGGVINCAIDKRYLSKQNSGATEFFAKLCKVKKDSEVMLLYNKKLSVSPLTTHINVNQIAKKINKHLIIKKILTINNWYKNKFKTKPKIGVLGLNPHNAELRINSEEKRIIIPSISKLKKSGVKVNGPLVADTVFIKEYKNYDLLVGMYHDQVLSPFKALFNFDAINITLGLKYIRVSPDHGTAVNLIGKKRANPSSLINCVNFLDKIIK